MTMAACFEYSLAQSFSRLTVRFCWPRTCVSAGDMAFLSWRRFLVAYSLGRSGFRRRVVDAVGFRLVGRRALHLPPDPHIDRKRNRHDHRNTDSQYEKPPEHPHNAFKDSRWAPARTCAESQTDRRCSS